MLDDFDLLHGRSVQRERTLDAHAVAELADRVGLLQPATLATDDVTLEHLDAFLAALDDADVHLQLVTSLEVGDVVAEGIVVDEVSGFHGVYLRCRGCVCAASRMADANSPDGVAGCRVA